MHTFIPHLDQSAGCRGLRVIIGGVKFAFKKTAIAIGFRSSDHSKIFFCQSNAMTKQSTSTLTFEDHGINRIDIERICLQNETKEQDNDPRHFVGY